MGAGRVHVVVLAWLITWENQAVDMKKMENLKRKVEWKVTEMVESGGMEAEEKKQKQKLKRECEDPEPSKVNDSASLRQCLGPGCVYPTRPGSKYCSDDCGMKLAADRIYEILPKSIQQWQQSPCIAEELGKKMLERIHREQEDTHTRLKELECHFNELEAIILRGKQQAVCEDEESNKPGRNSVDLQICCVSCGQAISVHVALRHMERCFAKYECKSTFGSLYPTCIEGATRLFCDVYNPQSKRYCKRLQVLCPEHSKDPKVSLFFLNLINLPSSLPGHPLPLLHKLEELMEQEQKVRTAMMNRAGLLALMLHQTIQHDPLTSDLRSKVDN
ncbi:CXXC-type zinc finger protein 1 [Camelus dromedarius]|uniref:CXXC-type zinc finger protein 1 n=1 Tax=Camelus dromedarius TaxID=9838 RepID=A0A5N4C0T1_CAMDR|nr:CXXC-type zinc finger protein 1 [Camelus dromedarius]